MQHETVVTDLGAVASARGFVRDRCRELGLDPDTVDTVELLTSEVVTNAILHGRSEARLRVSGGPGRLRVEVADENSRHPQPQEADPEALDGRGLAILEMLAARWGVGDRPAGKVVWFEVGA